MDFYLLSRTSDSRLIIDNSLRIDCIALESVTADSWIEAKQNLGFPLTVSQFEILSAR
jgi:hypothetical protein